MRGEIKKRLEALEAAVHRGTGFIDADPLVQQLLMLRDVDLDTEGGIEAAIAEVERRNAMTPLQRMDEAAMQQEQYDD